MNEEGKLEWGDPPPKTTGGRKGGDIGAFLKELRSRPGEWAKLPGTHTGDKMTRIKKGMYAGTKPGEFEATSRTAPDDPELKSPQSYLWVRYVGSSIDGVLS